MADLTLSPEIGSEVGRPERRSGVDRRSGPDRRTVNLWRETGRFGLELRTGADRRTRVERRGDRRHRGHDALDFVTPWQIPEGTPDSRRMSGPDRRLQPGPASG
jgi:hypothetical protein